MSGGNKKLQLLGMYIYLTSHRTSGEVREKPNSEGERKTFADVRPIKINNVLIINLNMWGNLQTKGRISCSSKGGEDPVPNP